MPLAKLACDVPVYGPMEHHQVSDSSVNECRCGYCVSYWQAREKMRALTEQIAETPCSCKTCQKPAAGDISAHSRGCKCGPCLALESALIVFTAAQNRREVFSELSFNAAHDEELDGQSLMAWLQSEMDRPWPSWITPTYRRRDHAQTSWWSRPSMTCMTIDDWIGRFILHARRVTITVSGRALGVFEVADV